MTPQLPTVLVLACVLSGCFQSDYDISPQSTPLYPVEPGFFTQMNFDIADASTSKQRNVLGKPQTIAVTKMGTAYHFVNVRDPDSDLYFRFYQAPQDESYFFVQASDAPQTNKPTKYMYFYGRGSADSFEFLSLSPTSKENLPSDIKSRVTLSLPDRSYFDIIDGSRDTLYVLREVILRRMTLETFATYVRTR
jgi:hypothetical protein